MDEQERKPYPDTSGSSQVLGPPLDLSSRPPGEELPANPEAPEKFTGPAGESTPPAAPGTLGFPFTAKDPAPKSDGNAGNTAKWIPASVSEFTAKLTESLNAMLKNMLELEVSTYVSEDLSDDVIREPAKESRRIAFTRIKLDGDIESIVPTYDGDVNEHLWRIHLDMVERAQNNRAQLIRTLTEAATGLIQVFK